MSESALLILNSEQQSGSRFSRIPRRVLATGLLVVAACAALLADRFTNIRQQIPWLNKSTYCSNGERLRPISLPRDTLLSIGILRSVEVIDNGQAVMMGKSGQSKDNLLVLSANGLEVCDSNQVIGTVNDIGEDEETGRIYAVTDGNGALVIENNTVTRLEDRLRVPDPSLDHRQYTIRPINHSFYKNAHIIASYDGPIEFDGTLTYLSKSQDKPLFVQTEINGQVWKGYIKDGLHTPDGDITAESNPEALGSNNVRAVIASPDGQQVWVGTDPAENDNSTDTPVKHGLSIYDIKTKTWAPVFMVDGKSSRVNDIQFDSQGRAWVATQGGVFYIRSDGKPIPYYNQAAVQISIGKPGNVLFNDSDILIATNGGLYRGTIPMR
jgi:hypothetical protein